MLAIIDTNYFIKNKLSDKPFEKGYLTTLIFNEIKDKTSKELHSLYSYKLEIKDPKEETIALVFNEIKSKNLCLSEADISFVALCLEFHDEYFNTWLGEDTQKVEFLTEDRGILAALSYLGINSDDFFEPKQFKFRCHACFTIYDEQRDFCKKCGYNTVVRVTVSYTDKMVLHLKKDFKPKNKELKIDGKVIYSADQKEYKKYLKEKNKKERRYQKIYETFNK